MGNKVKLLASMVIVLLALTGCSHGNTAAHQAPPVAPDRTMPVAAVPVVANPAGSKPVAGQPSATGSSAGQPGSSQPGVAPPATTVAQSSQTSAQIQAHINKELKAASFNLCSVERHLKYVEACLDKIRKTGVPTDARSLNRHVYLLDACKWHLDQARLGMLSVGQSIKNVRSEFQELQHRLSTGKVDREALRISYREAHELRCMLHSYRRKGSELKYRLSRVSAVRNQHCPGEHQRHQCPGDCHF